MSRYYPGNDIDLGTIVGSDKSVILTRQDRSRHTYIVGASRTGKTKLFEGIARQDLLKWPNYRCPMVIIDPHDTLYDGLMGFAAAEGLKEWPIIPFDLRRDDLIVSYNLLKRRHNVKPSVICRAVVESIVHAWGQDNTQETPRLASMLESILMVAYEKDCTLVEALEIINDPEMRRSLTEQVEHLVARATLRNARDIGERVFQQDVRSTMYRINTFLTNDILQATLCARTGQTLDISEVLEQGKILLVCLSTAGAKIGAADAAAIGSVILTDLWTAAKRRGKAEEGARVPCYLHIDEFQNFLTPDIAIGLTEASGYGLHLTLAHQYPSQLPDRGGRLGQMILNAILATAKNKISFQLEHPKDVDLLATVFGRQMVDLKKIKQEIWTTKIAGYDLTYVPSYAQSTSDGTIDSQQWGNNRHTSHTMAADWKDNVGQHITLKEGLDKLADHNISIEDKAIDSPSNKQILDTFNQIQNVGMDNGHASGGSESNTELDGNSYQEGQSQSRVDTESVSWVPMLIPILEETLSSREFESREEQLYRIGQFLDAQPDRHCLVRLASHRIPCPLFTKTINKPMTTEEYRRVWETDLLQRLPFVMSMTDAKQQIANRSRTLRERLLPSMVDGEPFTARRKTPVRDNNGINVL